LLVTGVVGSGSGDVKAEFFKPALELLPGDGLAKVRAEES
jgi:hypothetical protein